MKVSFLFGILFWSTLFVSHAQMDTTMLLEDKRIQIESTTAVNHMYNFKFDIAEAYFLSLKQRYPEHPMPYFLMALSNWWKMVPSLDDENYTNAFESEFLGYLDEAISRGEDMIDADQHPEEAAFFLCAAYGFKGRYYSDNKSYVKAAWAGKSALNYLNDFKGKSNLSPEFLFGESLFNYYAEWLKEEYPLLRPIIGLFPKGNKKLGLAQLQQCARNSFYTRVEAQTYLMHIYYNEENNSLAAYPYAEYLATTFPDNPYFQRTFARLSFSLGKWDVCEKICYDINYKVNIGMPGYEEAHTGRYACAFLGRILYEKGEEEKAIFYLKKAVDFAEKTNKMSMGYSLMSAHYMGLACKKKKDNAQAKTYFNKVITYASEKTNASKEFSANAHFALAEIAEQELNYKEAERLYKKTQQVVQSIEVKKDNKEYFYYVEDMTKKCQTAIIRVRTKQQK